MAKTLRIDQNKIKALRVRRNWPQEQLARIADLSPRTIQRIEAGGNASFETLRSIASAFEIEVDQLVAEQPTKGADLERVAGEDRPAASLAIKTRGNQTLQLVSAALGGGLLATIALIAYLSPLPTTSQSSAGLGITPAPGIVSTPSIVSPEVRQIVRRSPGETRPNGAFRKQRRQDDNTEIVKAQIDAPSWPVLESVPFTPSPLLVSLPADRNAQVVSDPDVEPGIDGVSQVADSSKPEIIPLRSGRGLTARTREFASSASDSFRQTGKVTAGFFSRLSVSMKKAF